MGGFSMGKVEEASSEKARGLEIRFMFEYGSSWKRLQEAHESWMK